MRRRRQQGERNDKPYNLLRRNTKSTGILNTIDCIFGTTDCIVNTNSSWRTNKRSNYRVLRGRRRVEQNAKPAAVGGRSSLEGIAEDLKIAPRKAVPVSPSRSESSESTTSSKMSFRARAGSTRTPRLMTPNASMAAQEVPRLPIRTKRQQLSDMYLKERGTGCTRSLWPPRQAPATAFISRPSRAQTSTGLPIGSTDPRHAISQHQSMPQYDFQWGDGVLVDQAENHLRSSAPHLEARNRHCR